VTHLNEFVRLRGPGLERAGCRGPGLDRGQVRGRAGDIAAEVRKVQGGPSEVAAVEVALELLPAVLD
jgi:hypothetical protein